MSLANESNYFERITHEAIHEISDSIAIIDICNSLKGEEARRDLVAEIIEKWEVYKDEYFTKN